jgi:hypothetical protein
MLKRQPNLDNRLKKAIKSKNGTPKYNTLNTHHSIFQCVNGMPKHGVNNGKLKPFSIKKYDERNAQILCLEFPFL